MSDFVATNSKDKVLKGNVLTISAEATEAKKKDQTVINSTAGMLFNEEGNLIKFKSVQKALDSLSDMDKYSYTKTGGTDKFKEGILRWSLQKEYELIKQSMHLDVIPTPGGSGAVSIAIGNYLNPNETILTSNLGWGPYQQMAKENFVNIDFYPLFDETYGFNYCEYEKHADEIIKKQGRIFTIINDPCHNPTGFQLELSDWKKIINHANKSNVPYVIFLDMAYIDYLPKGIDASREVFKEFLNVEENVLILLGFSGSKTFSVYGMRLGALVCMTKNKEVCDEFFRVNEFSARARWSNINHAGISLVEKIILDEQLRTAFMQELVEASKMLMERAILFMNEANKINLKYYPYKGGFFITIPCNGNKVYEELRKKGIFVVPFDDSIRISLSALSKKDIKGLAKKVQNEIV